MPFLPRTFLYHHRKSIAISASVALHLGVLLTFLLPSSGALTTLDRRREGVENVEGIDLSLLQPAEDVPAPLNAMGEFSALVEATDAQGWKPLDAPKSGGSLSELFGTGAFNETLQAETVKTSASENHVEIAGRNKQTPNDLWKAIEPCWNRLAPKGTVGATLSVSFSPLGNLAKPPVIIRTQGTVLSDLLLRSESLAINALAQCGPYLMAYGQSDVQINFPKR